MSHYTFLPHIDQQRMRREYRVRVLIVLIFFVAVSIVIGVTSLFPAYVYSTLEEKMHLNQVETIQKSTDVASVAVIQKQLAASKVIVDAIGGTVQADIFSTTIKSIAGIRGMIQINSFLAENTTNSLNLTVSGIAPTRADLLAFKNKLQTVYPQAVLNLPISTLAEDSNITFSIQLIETLK